MFNLENAIAAWRRQMQAELNPDVLDELEVHLHDELDHQKRAGSNPEEAFHTAVRLMGDAVKLRDEFAKSDPPDLPRRRRFMRAICFVSAAAIVLINTWSLVLFNLGIVERVLGASAVAAAALYLIALPFLDQILSPAAYRRFLGLLKIASNLAALFPIILLLSLTNVINLQTGPVTLIVWLLFAAVALSVLAIAFGHDKRSGGPGDAGASGPFLPAGPSGGPLDIPPPNELKSARLLESARAEAFRLGHDFIGTEHVLLALLKDEEGANLLRAWSTYESVRTEIEQLVSPQPAQNISTIPPLTPRARKALQIARSEAKRSKQAFITAHHILSGLILEGGGIAAKILNRLRVRTDHS